MFLFCDSNRVFYNKRLVVNLQRKSRTPADRNYEPYGLQRSVICVNNTICLEISVKGLYLPNMYFEGLILPFIKMKQTKLVIITEERSTCRFNLMKIIFPNEM